MAVTQPVFRFAPSPNGWLHLGHALSAVLNFRAARRAGGRFLLRIEDIDPARSRDDYIQGALDDLAWLGLAWDEPVWRQSARFDSYRTVLDGLKARGLVYPCFCSRGEIARAVDQKSAVVEPPCDPDGAALYPGTCRSLSAGEVADRLATGARPALRLDMANVLAQPGSRIRRLRWQETAYPGGGRIRQVPARPEVWGDVVLGRNTVPTSYHLAVVLDDAQQGITHVVRGVDLFQATGLHRLLQDLLGLPEPVYHHHRLVLDEAGRKLSKSRLSLSLKSIRAGGATRDDVLRLIGLD